MDQLTHQVRLIGRSIYNRRVWAKRCYNPILSQQYFPDLLRSWKRSKHHVRMYSAFGETLGTAGTESNQIVCLLNNLVENHNWIACSDQVSGHRIAHITNAYKKQIRLG